jgi:sodium transport system permease protein
MTGPWNIARSVGLQLALVLGIPFMASRALRLRFQSVYKLNPLAWRDFALTLLLTMCLVVLLEEVSFVQSIFLPDSKKVFYQMEEMVRANTPSQFLWILIAMAVVPAVCEESLFRGFLLERLSLSYPRWTAIFLTSFLFGIFHQNPYSFLSATLAGVMLCFILVRTQSLLSVITSHFVFNTWGIIVVNTSLREWQPWMEGKVHVPAVLLIPCLAGIWCGGRYLGGSAISGERN